MTFRSSFLWTFDSDNTNCILGVDFACGRDICTQSHGCGWIIIIMRFIIAPAAIIRAVRV